jgi:hypothetical protein
MGDRRYASFRLAAFGFAAAVGAGFPIAHRLSPIAAFR